MKTLFEICMYTDVHKEEFKQMLGICFNQDYKIPVNETQLDELCEDFVRPFSERILFIDLLFVEGNAKGFAVYQVDTPRSDWCEKEDWGFIRELYIASDVRRKGYGEKLVRHAEETLEALSVPNIYLTTDEAMIFWSSMGYCDTGEICEKNEGRIFVKE